MVETRHVSTASLKQAKSSALRRYLADRLASLDDLLPAPTARPPIADAPAAVAAVGPDLGFAYESYRATGQKQQFFRTVSYDELDDAYWEDLDAALQKINDYCNANRTFAQIVLIIVKPPAMDAPEDWQIQVISRVLRPMQAHILEVEFG